MKGLDLSFATPPAAWWVDRYAEGYRLAVQDLWTGASVPGAPATTLARARAAGLVTAGYTVVNTFPAATAVNKAVAAAGAEWQHLAFVSVDVEIATTPEIIRQALNGLRALGKRVCIYTAAWFWGGLSGDFSDVAAWLADYDGNPALDTLRLGRLGPVIGKQYAGTTQLAGHAVDLNTFDDAFITGQEEDMGIEFSSSVNFGKEGPGLPKEAVALADLLARYRRDIYAIRAEVARLKALGGSGPLVAKFPGATVQVPPMDVPVEEA